MTEGRLQDHAEHVFPVRVYYEDTDAGGVVYHSNYLRFAERARTELLRDFGIDHTSLMKDRGLMFAVRRCEAEFQKVYARRSAAPLLRLHNTKMTQH
jgi:acyl-CoA thioester hydrolase